MEDEATFCMDCGMLVFSGEYHPYAACLMFKQCRDSGTVRGNLADVVEYGKKKVSPAPPTS